MNVARRPRTSSRAHDEGAAVLGRRLAPLVDQFVAQLWDVLGQATVGELAASTQVEAATRQPASKPNALPPARRRGVRADREAIASPADDGVITDPHALLEHAERGRLEAPASGHDERMAVRHEDAEASTASSTATVAEGETVLRAGGSGLVLRRRRRPVPAAGDEGLDAAPRSSDRPLSPDGAAAAEGLPGDRASG